jgi:hypothetical protein
MAMISFFGPVGFVSEILYTAIVVFFCFLIYFKTKEMYDLTKYKGIHYFRNAFLFFGLAYLFRFVIHVIQFTNMAASSGFDIGHPRRMMFPFSMLVVSYLSTMAIFYLTYSTSWKKIKYVPFIIISNVVAILLSVTSFIFRSPFILSLLQLLLLLASFIIIVTQHKKSKKKTTLPVLYLLIFVFWFLNIFVLDSRNFFPFEFKIIFQLISVGVFIAIFYKVKKWIK